MGRERECWVLLKGKWTRYTKLERCKEGNQEMSCFPQYQPCQALPGCKHQASYHEHTGDFQGIVSLTRGVAIARLLSLVLNLPISLEVLLLTG